MICSSSGADEGGANKVWDRMSQASFGSSTKEVPTQPRTESPNELLVLGALRENKVQARLVPKTRPSAPDELLVIGALDKQAPRSPETRPSVPTSLSSSAHWTN